MGVLGAAGVSPEGNSIEDYIVRVECEFNVGESYGGCDDCSVDCMEGRQFTRVDAALFCDYVQLGSWLVHGSRARAWVGTS